MNTVAFDIDGTWTLEPDLWIQIYRLFETAGWQCIFVTGATQPNDKLRRLGILDIAPKIVIITAVGVLKADAASAAGYEVDVWIDDKPGFIERCRVLEHGADADY